MTCAYLDTDLTVNVNELGIDELLLEFLNLGVVDRPANQPFQRANGVLEV